MDELLAYYIVVSLSFFSAFMATLRFYAVRMRSMASEQKPELAPILAISLSFLVGFLTTLLKLISLGYPSVEMLLIAELAGPLFALAMLVAVALALRRPRLVIIGVVFLSILWAISLVSPHPLQEPFRAIWITVSNLILVIPGALFGYLWLTTKRSTAFGLLVGVILYMGFISIMSVHPIEYGFIAVFLATLGFAFTSFSFMYYERRLGGEIIGYSFSMTIVAEATAFFLILMETIPLDSFLSIFLVANSGAVSLLTGSYLYGRYREKPFRQTLALALFMFISGVSWVMTAIYDADSYAHVLGLTTVFRAAYVSVGLISAGFLFLSAVYALDLGKVAILPVFIVALCVALEFLFGPNEGWVVIVMTSSYSVMVFVPIVMFAVLWRRIRAAKETDAGKPLGISVGLLVISVSTIVQLVPMLLKGPLRFLGAVIILLAVSGRIDKWLYGQNRQPQKQPTHR